MKIEIFKGSNHEAMQRKVNDFLVNNPDLEIRKMIQSESVADNKIWSLAITLLLEEKQSENQR